MYDDSNVGKFIVFKITDYLLALPISDVLKVVNCPSVANKGLTTMGVVQLGQHMIKVLDLHLPQLGAGDLTELTGHQSFLVITRDRQGELCGILVDEPPNLLELPLEMMRSLPTSNHHSQPLFEMVSHVAVVSQGEVKTTIFLLDVQRLSNTTINDSYPLALKPSAVT